MWSFEESSAVDGLVYCRFYGDGIRAYDILGGSVHAEDDCGDLYEMLRLHGTAAPSDEGGSSSTWREERRETTMTTTVISKSSKQAAWYGSSDWSDTKVSEPIGFQYTCNLNILFIPHLYNCATLFFLNCDCSA